MQRWLDRPDSALCLVDTQSLVNKVCTALYNTNMLCSLYLVCMIIFACLSTLFYFVFFFNSLLLYWSHVLLWNVWRATVRCVKVSHVKLLTALFSMTDLIVCWLIVTSLRHRKASNYQHASPHLYKDLHSTVAAGSELLTVLLMWQNKVISHDQRGLFCVLLMVLDSFTISDVSCMCLCLHR